MTGNTNTKTAPLAVTQAKVTRADGRVEYHMSIPKVSFWNFTGRIWLRRQIKQLKHERTN